MQTTQETQTQTPALKTIIRTVMVFLVYNQREVLLMKHPLWNLWVGPGGKLDSGEMFHEAATRELHEEMGLTVQPLTRRLDARSVQLPRPVMHYYDIEPGVVMENCSYIIHVGDDVRDAAVVPEEKIQTYGWFDLQSWFDAQPKADFYIDTWQILDAIQHLEL